MRKLVWLPRRGLAIAGLGAAVTALAIALPAAASAGTTVTVRYPVTGVTVISANNSSLKLGPGKLTTTADLSTGALKAKLVLPPATGSFTELGIIPVTATTEFIQDGPTTGTLNATTGAVTTTSNVTLRITSLTVAGLPVSVGSTCESSTPAAITVASQPGFNIADGGNLSGAYTIPPFANCGLDTLVINLTIPGPNNTITLTLGKGKRIG
jgi:hypothetical protein